MCLKLFILCLLSLPAIYARLIPNISNHDLHHRTNVSVDHNGKTVSQFHTMHDNLIGSVVCVKNKNCIIVTNNDDDSASMNGTIFNSLKRDMFFRQCQVLEGKQVNDIRTVLKFNTSQNFSLVENGPDVSAVSGKCLYETYFDTIDIDSSIKKEPWPIETVYYRNRDTKHQHYAITWGIDAPYNVSVDIMGPGIVQFWIWE